MLVKTVTGNNNLRGSITACLTYFLLDSVALVVLIEQYFYFFGQVQTSQTGRQPSSDTSPNYTYKGYKQNKYTQKTFRKANTKYHLILRITTLFAASFLSKIVPTIFCSTLSYFETTGSLHNYNADGIFI